MTSGRTNGQGLKGHVRKNGLIFIILLVGLGLTLLRFTCGIGAVTNLSDRNPWGFWMAFDLLCGIAVSAGGFAVASAYYIFGFKQFHVYVRAALTTAFLGYFFEVIALLYEVGQPWRLVYPFFLSQGTTSVLFLVGLCVALYLTVLSCELLPALFERLDRKKAWETAVRLAAPLAVIGAVVAVVHQSSLGSLYLIVPSKMHPLWYSRFMPLFFLLSSLFAGLSMVVVEGRLAHKFMRGFMDDRHARDADRAVLACGRGAYLFMLGYFVIRCMELAAGGNLRYLFSGYGVWFLLELVGGVALPAFMYFIGVRSGRLRLIQRAAIIAVLGVMLNRFNVGLVAFNYNLPPAERYFPSWMEVAISVFLVTLLVIAYRCICSGVPILRTHENYGEEIREKSPARGSKSNSSDVKR
ncbi:MAG: polysulfide reductase NrfD [Desulfovibrio sp.]|jgi:Ni/Fe-hydrogenase subunit HybB-like protein|nr:polysulfide reductase NrfD [Desulfovibrio sp.]